MKKTYIIPAIQAYNVQAMSVIALSIQDGNADNSDVLTKDKGDWDLWNTSGSDDAFDKDAD